MSHPRYEVFRENDGWHWCWPRSCPEDGDYGLAYGTREAAVRAAEMAYGDRYGEPDDDESPPRS